MPQIFPQMFTKYTLYASNSKGTAKHTFTLEEGKCYHVDNEN